MHQHGVEHAWYILSGQGTITIGDETWDIGPDMAIFAPIGVPHQVRAPAMSPCATWSSTRPQGPERGYSRARGSGVQRLWREEKFRSVSDRGIWASGWVEPGSSGVPAFASHNEPFQVMLPANCVLLTSASADSPRCVNRTSVLSPSCDEIHLHAG